MLYIRVELWPRGNRQKSSVLGEAIICNTMEGTPTQGDYRGYFSRKGGFGSVAPNVLAAGCAPNPWKAGHLTGFARKRLGAWHLLFRMLEKVIDG